MARSFRDDDPAGYVAPPSIEEYKPPSVLAQHKGLAIAFAIVILAFAAYCLRAPQAKRRWPTRPEPVYIESLPASQPNATPPAP